MMSCPNWNHLVAHRYEGPEAVAPPGWNEALEHLESCIRCRDEALAADPALVFRRIPPSETDTGVDAAELNVLRTGVDALRRANRVEEHSRSRPFLDRSRQTWTRLARTASRVAAAALLAAALLSVQPEAPTSEGPASTTATAAARSLEAALKAAPSALGGAEPDTMAAVDKFDRPNASIYHIDDEELNVVMVVDPELDV